ncbi:MAG: hypothetical protein ACKO0Z_18370, partial [Betaproteobacteria bacterium]
LAEDFFKRFELALQEKYPESAFSQTSGAQEEGAVTQAPSAQTGASGTPKWLWPLVAGVVAGLVGWWLTR